MFVSNSTCEGILSRRRQPVTPIIGAIRPLSKVAAKAHSTMRVPVISSWPGPQMMLHCMANAPRRSALKVTVTGRPGATACLRASSGTKKPWRTSLVWSSSVTVWPRLTRSTGGSKLYLFRVTLSTTGLGAQPASSTTPSNRTAPILETKDFSPLLEQKGPLIRLIFHHPRLCGVGTFTIHLFGATQNSCILRPCTSSNPN